MELNVILLLLILSNSFFVYSTNNVSPQETICTDAKADIVILLDKSGSISKNDFEIMRQFAIDMVNQLSIRKDTIHLSSVGFETSVKIEFSWKFNKNEIIEKIKEIIKPDDGATATGDALFIACTELLKKGRRNVRKIIILFTDGENTEGREPIPVANKIKKDGVTIISVGIGSGIQELTLKAISSPGSTFISKNFADLKNHFASLLKKTCIAINKPVRHFLEGCKDDKMDIVVILDKSRSMQNKYLKIIKRFVIDMTNQLPLGPNNIRLSCVGFETKSKVEFMWSFDKNEIVKKVNGIYRPINGTRSAIGTALSLAKQQLLSKARLDAKKVIILLSDGRNNGGKKPIKIAQTIKDVDKVTIITVGTGKSIDKLQLRKIASRDFDIISNYYGDLKYYFRRIQQCPEFGLQTKRNELEGDIIIILDKSERSIPSDDFEIIQRFVFEMELLQKNTKTIRLSCVCFDNAAAVVLDWTFDADEMIKKIKQVVSKNTTKSAIGDALFIAKEQLLSKARVDVKKTIVLFSIRKNNAGSNQPKKIAKEIKDSGVTIITIGIGSEFSSSELKGISSPSISPVLTYSCYDLRNYKDDIVKLIMSSLGKFNLKNKRMNTPTLEECQTKATFELKGNHIEDWKSRDFDCYSTKYGMLYSGTINVTKSGKTCQAWASDSPHKIGEFTKNDCNFPERSRELAKNYCRNPGKEFKTPWCYTTDPNYPTEQCEIEKCKPIVCTDATADIVFIIDKSSSVSKDNFKKMQQFVIDMVNKLTIGSNAIRVSCISYSDKATIDFDWMNAKKDIEKKIWIIQPTTGNTATGDALRLAQTALLSKGRNGIRKLIILLNDGVSNEGEDSTVVASEIKNSGVAIFVVGIGDQIEQQELESIASENSLFISNSFNDLQRHFAPLMKKTCTAVSIVNHK